MPGDWIKLEKSTLTKPEVYELGDILGIGHERALVAVITAWCWFDSELASCCAPKSTETALNRLTGIPGFTKAMLQVGWLVHEDGGFRVPNFERHLSKSAKRRALAARYMHDSREQNVAHEAQQNVVQSKSKSKKNKEENPPTPLGGKFSARGKSKPKAGHAEWTEVSKLLPEGSPLRCPEFEQAWGDWVQHRTEIRKKLTAKAVKLQIADLERMGLNRALAAIAHSVKHGYTGIYEPGHQQADSGDRWLSDWTPDA